MEPGYPINEIRKTIQKQNKKFKEIGNVKKEPNGNIKLKSTMTEPKCNTISIESFSSQKPKVRNGST